MRVIVSVIPLLFALNAVFYSFNANTRRVSQAFTDPFAGEDDELSSGDESDTDGEDGTSMCSGSNEDDVAPLTGKLRCINYLLSRW